MSQPVTPIVRANIADLVTDHTDLGEYLQAIGLTDYRSAGTGQTGEIYWSTDARAGSDPTQEVIEIQFSSPQLLNWFQVDLAMFPHTLRAQYADVKGNWYPLLISGARTPLLVSVMHSVPPVLPQPASVSGHRHPQHSFVGHWQHEQIPTVPTEVQRMRLILQRTSTSTGPVDIFGNLVPYSLAIRNLNLGYRVTSQTEVPRTLPKLTPAGDQIQLGYTDAFAFADDVLGSKISFGMRQQSPNRILDNTAEDADDPWVCEPQPYPNNVVSFYVDLGKPQVVDQIYLDPVNNGPHLSLYYTNDLPTAPVFSSQADPISIWDASVTGPVDIDDNGYLSFGQYGDAAYLDVPNAKVALDPGVPWWVGVTVAPDFDQGQDDNVHPILDCGAFQLALTNVGVQLSTAGGDVVVCPIAYQNGLQIALIASYDTQNYYIRAVTEYDDENYSAPVTNPIPTQNTSPIATLRFGGDLTPGTDQAVQFLNSELVNLVLKQEALSEHGYLDNAEPYITVARYAADDDPATINALLRLDVDNPMISAQFPWGLFGGPAQVFDQMSWIPVPRDYTMATGWMKLPTTKARYWKLEFTNLVPIYHDINQAVPQLVKYFPHDVAAKFAALQQSGNNVAYTDGQDAQAGLVGVTPYNDYAQNISTGGTGVGYTNAEAYVADQYQVAQQLRHGRGSDWAYVPWHTGRMAPSFDMPGVHTYETETVTRTSKIAYSVGMRTLVFGRAQLAARQDIEVFEDMFFDDQNLTSSSFLYDAGAEALTSGDGSYKSSATSIVFNSLRGARGAQYAAQQSPPNQLLPDEEFLDPNYANWELVGDASVETGLTSSSSLGSLLPISRYSIFGYWGDIKPNYPTWGDLRANQVTYGALRYKQAHGTAEGGIQSQLLAQPLGGRLYAAGRVVSDQPLSSPLWVQIMDINGTVLAEAPADVTGGQVVEWYVGFTIGSGVTRQPNTWGDLDGHNSTNPAAFVDSFARANAPALGMMDSSQSWTSPNNAPLSIASNAATVTATGQCSQVDVGTPWGSLTLALGNTVTTGTQTASVPLLLLGDWWLMNDGRLIDANTGRTLATLTLATNDIFNFSIQPTSSLSSVPAGRDATVQSWAVVIKRNNVVVTTLASTRAISSVRALMGANGQTFTSFNWTPYQTQPPSGTVIDELPMPTDGVLAPDGTSWTQGSGLTWAINQPVSFGNQPLYLGSAPTITANAGTTNPTVTAVGTDLGQQYGTLSFTVGQLAPTIPQANYYLALLDRNGTNSLYLRADGALVRVAGATTTVLLATAVTVTAGANIAIKYVLANTLSAAFRTTWSIPTSATQALIFMLNDVVTSVYLDSSDNNVAALPVAGSPNTPDLTGPNKAMYNKLPVPVPDPTRSLGMQSFQFDAAHSRMYTLQSYDGTHGNLYLSWINTTTGVASTEFMTLKGFDHGQQFGLQIVGATTYIWMGCDSVNTSPNTNAFATKICRFVWTPGATLTSSTGVGMTKYTMQPGSTGNGVMIDGTRLLLQYTRGVGYLVAYNLADVVASGAAAVPIAPPVRIASYTGTMQGRALYGDYCYSISGNTKSPDCGPVQPVSLNWQNIFTGVAGSFVTPAGSELPRREPEGVAIQTVAGQGRLVWSFATKNDCSGQGNTLQSFYYEANTIWTNTTRSLLGYNDGAGHFTITTGYSWSPDANGVLPGGPTVTWGQASNHGTKTFGDMANFSVADLNEIRVRVVQKMASHDSWYMDTLSLFHDPVIWEFSNDGGTTWVAGYDVRNDPQGVVAFPSLNVNDPNAVNNQLCYRVTAYGPNVWISHLAIRPWYVGFMHDVPSRPQGSIQGPNINPHDHYPPIEQDPRWMTWHLPVPRNWWFAFRDLNQIPEPELPYVVDSVITPLPPK